MRKDGSWILSFKRPEQISLLIDGQIITSLNLWSIFDATNRKIRCWRRLYAQLHYDRPMLCAFPGFLCNGGTPQYQIHQIKIQTTYMMIPTGSAENRYCLFAPVFESFHKH
jgi:hypothetical protein